MPHSGVSLAVPPSRAVRKTHVAKCMSPPLAVRRPSCRSVSCTVRCASRFFRLLHSVTIASPRACVSMPILCCAAPLSSFKKNKHALFAGGTTLSSRIAMVIVMCVLSVSALYSSESLQKSNSLTMSTTSKIVSLSLESVFSCVTARITIFYLWLWLCGGIKIQTQLEAIASRWITTTRWVADYIALVHLASGGTAASVPSRTLARRLLHWPMLASL